MNVISPRICVSIVGDDVTAVQAAEPLADLFEVRIDLIGGGWERLAGQLKKPWIACNRSEVEGGSWKGGEKERIEQLLRAAEMGAGIVDIELAAPGLAEAVGRIKGRAECLLSYHDLRGTPSLEAMREIVRRQLDAGADICKLVTTARNFTDNIAVFGLIFHFCPQNPFSFYGVK